MPLEHAPSRAGAYGDTVLEQPEADAGFWYSLIDEKVAAAFLDLSVRSMQGYRYKGGGPKFVRLSSRCVKYRRVDCREWSETKLRTSTSDPGQGAA